MDWKPLPERFVPGVGYCVGSTETQMHAFVKADAAGGLVDAITRGPLGWEPDCLLSIAPPPKSLGKPKPPVAEGEGVVTGKKD